MVDPSVLKHVMESSSQLSTWALAIFAGSVAVVVSTSYRRPESLRWRLLYLLFIPGWASIGYSLHLANTLVGKYLASIMGSPDRIDLIAYRVNEIYADQLDYLLFSLAFFGLWLLTYLLSWIFVDSFHTGDKK